MSSVGWIEIKGAHKQLTPHLQIQLLRHSSKTAAGALRDRFSRLLFEPLFCSNPSLVVSSLTRAAAASSARLLRFRSTPLKLQHM
jgi:hypothetical protein